MYKYLTENLFILNMHKKFEKGTSGNGAGRPKGALNKERKLWNEVRAKAFGDAEEIYDIAKKRYIEENDKVSARLLETFLDVPKSWKDNSMLQLIGSTQEEQISSFVESYDTALVSKDEAIELMKLYSSLKLANAAEKSATINIADYMTDEEVQALYSRANKENDNN